MTTRTLAPPDHYRLDQSVGFLSGFTPQPVEAGDGEIRLRFATPLSPSWTPTAITVTQPGDDLVIDWSGDADGDAVVGHVRRILSLDVDGSGFAELLRRDTVIDELVEHDRGIRPPLFWSPYEAAVWAVLSQRIRMKQATRLKTALAEELGSHPPGQDLRAMPSPVVLAELDDFAKIPTVKIERIRAVARAALDGLLDPGTLREQSVGEATEALQTIDGIGPFSAELVLVRGAGAPDVFPRHEKRLHATMRNRYDVPDASIEDLVAIAERWAPYRSWVSFQLRAATEREEWTGRGTTTSSP